MKKLTISELMTLTEEMEKSNWLCLLLEINNSGKIGSFLKMVKKHNLISMFTPEKMKSLTR